MKLYRYILAAALLPLLALLCALDAAAEKTDGGITAEIPICVQPATGESAAEAVSYFSLEAAGSAPLPARCILRIEGAGSGSFGPICYTLPGDYCYTVRQTAAAAAYRRDTTVYAVTVRVVHTDTGALSAEVFAAADAAPGDKVHRLVFTAALRSPAVQPAAVQAVTVSRTTVRQAAAQQQAELPPLLLCLAAAAATIAAIRLAKGKNSGG